VERWWRLGLEFEQDFNCFPFRSAKDVLEFQLQETPLKPVFQFRARRLTENEISGARIVDFGQQRFKHDAAAHSSAAMTGQLLCRSNALCGSAHSVNTRPAFVPDSVATGVGQ